MLSLFKMENIFPILFKLKLLVIKVGLIFFFGINKPANGLVEFQSSNDLRFKRYATCALFQINIPSDKFYCDISDIGNTVSSSIPIALANKVNFKSKSNIKILIVGFGVGLSWGIGFLKI